MAWRGVSARVLAALALVLLAAHFWRAQTWVAVATCAMLSVLLFVDRTWARRVVQLALVAGALEWLWTAFWLAQQRQALGMPWTRMAVILGAVALLTAAASLALGRWR